MKKYLFLLLICFNLSASEWDCENCYDYGFKYGLTYSNVDFNQAKTSYYPGVSAGFAIISYINTVFSFQTEIFINNTNYKIDKLTEKENETYSYVNLKEEVYYSFEINMPFTLNIRFSPNLRIYTGIFFEVYLYNKFYESYSDFFPVDVGYLGGFSINISPKYLIDFRYVKGIVNLLFPNNGHYYNHNYQEYYKHKFLLLLGMMF